MENENDNMETIIYRGSAIQAQLMGEIDGQHMWGRRDAVSVGLYRDAQGFYYLQRESHNSQDGQITSPLFASKRAAEFDYRRIVHRVGINAAILWAVGQLGNGDPWNLRVDAGNAIMEDKGYDDPNPVYWRYAEHRQKLAGKDALATAGQPTRPSYQLDAVASAMLRKACANGTACHHAGEDPRDLINAAVTFYLCGEDNDQHGDFDLNDSSDALKRATHDRLALEAQAPAAAPRKEATVIIPLLEQPPGVHHFTFDYPATGKVCGRRREVELSDAQMERAGELAAHFDLSVEAFLCGLADNNDLPGQPRRSGNKLADVIQAADIAFVCMDEAMAARIERAAQACKRTADEFVADAVGRDVDMYEEDMLVHPATGALLDDEFKALYEEGKVEITAAPVGREHEPQFRMRPGRQYVNFGAYLTLEQLERLEFPHMVSDCAADQEVKTLLIPFDEDSTPFLQVGGKQVQAAEPVVEAEEAA